MNRASAQYLRSIKKKLTCTPATKKRLIAQLDAALSNYIEEHPDATLKMLNSAFGDPENMASSMMIGISESDISSFQKYNRIRQILAGLVIVLFVMFTLYIFIRKQKPIVSYNEAFPCVPSTSSTLNTEEEST